MSDASQQPASKMTYYKNILFGIIILAAVIICYGRFHKRAQDSAFNQGVAHFDAGLQIFNEGINDASEDFQAAIQDFQAIVDAKENAELTSEATKMLARSYALLAQCPSTLHADIIRYYKEALRLDPQCPDVSDHVRARYGNYTAEEKEAIIETLREKSDKEYADAPSLMKGDLDPVTGAVKKPASAQ